MCRRYDVACICVCIVGHGYTTLAKEQQKNLEHEGNGDTNCNMCTWRMCPWCNGYRRRKWTRRREFKSWTRLIAFHMALILLGKVWIQLFSLHLWVNSRTDLVLQPWWGNKSMRRITLNSNLLNSAKNWPCFISCPSGVNMVMCALGTIPKDCVKRVEESEPSKPQHCWDQMEYWEESWRIEETCCHSDFNKSPPAIAGVKNSQKMKQ